MAAKRQKEEARLKKRIKAALKSIADNLLDQSENTTTFHDLLEPALMLEEVKDAQLDLEHGSKGLLEHLVWTEENDLIPADDGR